MPARRRLHRCTGAPSPVYVGVDSMAVVRVARVAPRGWPSAIAAKRIHVRRNRRATTNERNTDSDCGRTLR